MCYVCVLNEDAKITILIRANHVGRHTLFIFMPYSVLMIRFLTIVLLYLFAQKLTAQVANPVDSIYLMSGKIITGYVQDTTGDRLKIAIPKGKDDYRVDYVDNELVFSVVYGKTARESVMYRQDTLFGNFFTPNEMRMYMRGERDARKHFKCPWATIGAFAFGAAGGYTQSFLMFLPPFIYSGATTAFRVNIRPGAVSNPNFLKYETYLMGYEREARKRRMFRTLIAGGAGMVAGFATSAIINGVN